MEPATGIEPKQNAHCFSELGYNKHVKEHRLVEEDDLVRKSVGTAHSLFEKVQFGRAFINGKLEITAKALLSAGWEASSGCRLAVMDKHFNRAPIDFLALENKAPKFWIETKFDNFCKPGETRKQAREAVTQALRYKAQLRQNDWPEIETLAPHDQEAAKIFRSQIGQSPSYIIHFLNHLPLEDELPTLIYRKFLAGVPAKTRNDVLAGAPAEEAKITLDGLSSYYGGATVEGKKVEVACLPIWNGPLWEDSTKEQSVGISAVAVRVP